MGVLPEKKEFVSSKNRKLRLSFAKSIINKAELYGNNVLFAEESKFNIFGSDGRKLYREEKIRNFILRTQLEQLSMVVELFLYGGECQHKDKAIWYLLK